MTYKELLDFLQSFESTDSRLSDKVAIFDAEDNSLNKIVELMTTSNGTLYFAYEQDD